MTDDWGSSAIGHPDEEQSSAFRSVRARGVLTGLVVLFVAGVVLTLALPSFG